MGSVRMAARQETCYSNGISSFLHRVPPLVAINYVSPIEILPNLSMRYRSTLKRDRGHCAMTVGTHTITGRSVTDVRNDLRDNEQKIANEFPAFDVYRLRKVKMRKGKCPRFRLVALLHVDSCW
jgi:hypothetical protein